MGQNKFGPDRGPNQRFNTPKDPWPLVPDLMTSELDTYDHCKVLMFMVRHIFISMGTEVDAEQSTWLLTAHRQPDYEPESLNTDVQTAAAASRPSSFPGFYIAGPP